jgi:anti-sigma factor RsiW
VTAKHLGEQIHELLDHRLNRADTYAAMDHLAECPECSERWRELRAAREALHSSKAGIDLRFTQQLRDRERMAHIAAGESKHRARAASGRGRQPLTVALAFVTVAVLGMSAAYVVGAPEPLTLEFAEGPSAGANASVAFHGPDSMRAGEQLRSWVHPDWEESGLVPIEAKVVQRGNGANMLVASVLVNLEAVVITEQHGQLVDARNSDLDHVEISGVTVFIVGENPAQVVWQAGEVVISASCDCAMGTLESVVGSFPSDGQPGFFDRVYAGFGEFAGVLTGD